jgi:uncharacterized membrane protein YdjX (TVP38/TMEM64 family)
MDQPGDTQERVIFNALGSWINWCGIILAATAIFNLSIKTFQLDLSEFFDVVLTGYRAVFHTIFDYLFFWVPILFKVELPWWLKDVFTLWILLAGSATRAYFHLEDYKHKLSTWMVKKTRFREVVKYLRNKGRVPFFLGMLVMWIPLLISNESFIGNHSVRFRKFFFQQLVAVILLVALMAATNHGLS